MFKDWLLFLLGVFCCALALLCMKLSHGFTKPVPSVLMPLLYLIGLPLTTIGLKSLPFIAASMIWMAFSSTLSLGFGVVIFGESLTPSKIFCVALILVGAAGLTFFKN